jgi:enoyl-CoA hydratase
MIITGSGEKAFVAGADIKEFESLDPKAASEFAFRGQKLFARLGAIGIPVIAAVNGFALGGGLELALACDFIYASENAKFGLPECTLGLLPGYGGTVRLPRRIGPARARELMYTGSMVGADEALRIGLVNRVVPQAELLKVAQETAQTIASRAPIAIAKIKDCVQNGAQITEERASELEARHFGELFATADQKEGVRAFIEKRKAQFQGR